MTRTNGTIDVRVLAFEALAGQTPRRHRGRLSQDGRPIEPNGVSGHVRGHPRP